MGYMRDNTGRRLDAFEVADRGPRRQVSLLWKKLQQNVVNANLLVMGDSTGDSIQSGEDRWPKLVTAWLASSFPTVRVNRIDWDAIANVYLSPVTVQSGTTPDQITDTFNRADAANITATETGQTWRADVGTIAVSGNKATASASAVATVKLPSPDGSASIVLTHPANKGAAADTSKRIYLRQQDSTNYIMVEAKVSDSGSFLTIYTTINNVTTVAVTNVTAGMAYSGTYTLTASAVGPLITATVGAVTITYTLTAAEQRTLLNQTRAGIGFGGNPAGNIDSFTYQPNPITLNVWNGSASGKNCGYSTTYFATMATVVPDQIIINHSHNEFFSDMRRAIHGLVQLCRNTFPHTSIALIAQNPRGLGLTSFTDSSTPTLDRTAGIQRVNSLIRYAQNEGLPVIDVQARFLEDGNYSTNLLKTDQLHPSAQGTIVWAEEVQRFLMERGAAPVTGDTTKPAALFIPATEMYAVEGSPALGLTGVLQGWQLDPSTQQSVACTVEVPAAWAEVNVYAVYAFTGTSGLTGSTNQVFLELIAGAALSASGTGSNQPLTPTSRGSVIGQINNQAGTAMTALILGTGPSAGYASLADAGRPLYVQVRRVAANAADTYAANLFLVGVRVVRAS